MRCSNCGAGIPFAGNVCPFCNANKSGDQFDQALGIVGMVLGATVGGAISGCEGVAIGGVVGAVVGLVGCKILRESQRQEDHGDTSPSPKTIAPKPMPTQVAKTNRVVVTKFRVHGTDKETGEECVFELQCVNAQEARAKANAAGYVVRKIEPLF